MQAGQASVQRAGSALLEPLPLAGGRGHQRDVRARLGPQHVLCLRRCSLQSSRFSSSALVRATVEKTCAHWALCVLLVPVAILKQHWGKLLAASVLPRAAPYVDGFLRIQNPSQGVSQPDAHCAAELALFACDFRRLRQRAHLPQLSP